MILEQNLNCGVIYKCRVCDLNAEYNIADPSKAEQQESSYNFLLPRNRRARLARAQRTKAQCGLRKSEIQVPFQLGASKRVDWQIGYGLKSIEFPNNVPMCGHQQLLGEFD